MVVTEFVRSSQKEGPRRVSVRLALLLALIGTMSTSCDTSQKAIAPEAPPNTIPSLPPERVAESVIETYGVNLKPGHLQYGAFDQSNNQFLEWFGSPTNLRAQYPSATVIAVEWVEALDKTNSDQVVYNLMVNGVVVSIVTVNSASGFINGYANQGDVVLNGDPAIWSSLQAGEARLIACADSSSDGSKVLVKIASDPNGN